MGRLIIFKRDNVMYLSKRTRLVFFKVYEIDEKCMERKKEKKNNEENKRKRGGNRKYR